MKKLLTIFLLATYALASTELSEILKFPLLVEHYYEHKSFAPDLSFKDFLILHYSNHLEHHADNEDYQKDKQLPFITHSGFIGFAVVLPRPYSLVANSEERLEKTILPHDPFVQILIVTKIWQPPRLA